MAIYHLEAKVVSRGNGRSAVAASAYLSCSKMLNDYDGIQHDFTRKKGLINQGGERICAGLAEKGQAYPFKFPLSLYQKFEIQRWNYHSKSSHALFKKAGDNHIFILLVFYR